MWACPPPEDLGPNGDGDGDGAADDLQVMERAFKNARVQAWCIHGQSSDYFALKVGSAEGTDFRFAGKCLWPWSLNKIFYYVDNPWAASDANKTLEEVHWYSTDTSRPPGKPGAGYVGSGHTIQYQFGVKKDILFKIEFDENGNQVPATAIVYSPAPTAYLFANLPPTLPEPLDCQAIKGSEELRPARSLTAASPWEIPALGALLGTMGALVAAWFRP